MAMNTIIQSQERSKGNHPEEGLMSRATTQPEETHGYSLPYRLGFVAFALAILVPILQGVPSSADTSPALGAEGGVIHRKQNGPFMELEHEALVRRDDSPTDVCTRWAHQSAIVNGTLYIYGGEATTSPSQTSDTWNNDFLSMDLTKTWQIASPSLSGLAQPSGPPNVSLGTLWNSHESLFLYGGEFSWKPAVSPIAFSLWEYNIASVQWIEHSDPVTSAGNNSQVAGQSIQRAAEGAGVAVPALGRGWYFGGHQDGYTTENWSQSVYRIYLKSLLEYTFPGFGNTQVSSLSGGQTTGTDGVWRNITEGGSQDGAGFPERADGLLLYVPGFGAEGILLGLAGGTNQTLTQMNVIDVFDIATSIWYKQSTSGSTPQTRVNPCAVVAAAPDGSSYNVYMFGGQNLLPADNQTQLNDMWILTIPSFTWIEVDQSKQAVPYARAGHTCNVYDGQMIVVGGYVGSELSCDSPGIYVYDMSSLAWVEQFTALGSSNSSTSGSSSVAGSITTSPGNTSPTGTLASEAENNPFNQQPAQLSNGTDAGGLEGSYGYNVPEAVISIIGGAATGGATVTAPQVTPTGGPLATGKALTYTVTQSGGAIVTETSKPSGSNSTVPGKNESSGNSGPNIAAIVAGTIAGILFILVCYLAFCAWLYRKQLSLYKRHIEMTQKQALGEKPPAIPGLIASNEESDKSSSAHCGTGGVIASGVIARGESNSASDSGGQSAWSNAIRNNSSGTDTPLRRTSSETGEMEDLLAGHEPTFLGIVLAPRRSLRVINRD